MTTDVAGLAAQRGPSEEPGSRTNGGFLSRMPEWLVAVCVGVFTLLVFTIPFLLHPFFYYVGDNPESFVPLWHHLGQQILGGHWNTMEVLGWYGGNYAGEAAYTLWNPVDVLNYILVAQFDSLNTAAALVMVEFVALFAMGSYLLAREYGARRVPAVVVGFAVPTAGYTLYYAASGWPAELTAITWVVWFWWACRRFTNGKLTPLVPFLIGVLAITTGNPYAALGMIVVLAGFTVEQIVRRQWRQLVHLLIMGACAGASCALMFLPLLGAMSVTNRETLAMIANNGFMVPHFSDLMASSAPTYLPPIVTFNNAVIETVPSTYFIWFVVPLLPWIRWRTVRSKLSTTLVSLGVITGLFLMIVLGPSNLWLFRWPARLLEYLYSGFGVIVALLLSLGLAKDNIRRRSWITAGIIAVGAYLTLAQTPQYRTIHIEATLIVAALVFGALWLYRNRGGRAFGATLLLGTVAVLAFQTARLPVVAAGPPPVQPPTSISRVTATSSVYQGTVLQLAQEKGLTPQDQASGELIFGNQAWMTGHEMINHYSGIGFQVFQQALCMDYKGQVCQDAYRRLWRTVPGTDVDLVDALRVRTLVIQRSEFPAQADQVPPSGWRVAATDHDRTVWVRGPLPVPYPGRVNWASQGTTINSASAGASAETINYSAPDGGQVMLAALDWPGYSATVDGRPLSLRNGPDGFIAITLPPGNHVVNVTFRQAGLRLGAYVLALATVIALVQAVWLWVDERRRRRRGESRPAVSADAPGDQDNTMRVALSHAGPARDGQ